MWLLWVFLFFSPAFLQDQSNRCTRDVVLEQDCSTLLALSIDTYTNIQLIAVSSKFTLQYTAAPPSNTLTFHIIHQWFFMHPEGILQLKGHFTKFTEHVSFASSLTVWEYNCALAIFLYPLLSKWRFNIQQLVQIQK